MSCAVAPSTPLDDSLHYSDYDDATADDAIMSRKRPRNDRDCPVIDPAPPKRHEAVIDPPGGDGDLPYSQCFLQDDDCNEEQLDRIARDEIGVQPQQPPKQISPYEDIIQKALKDGVDLETPDEKLSDDAILKRKNYDAMAYNEAAFNMAQSMVRDDPYRDESCQNSPQPDDDDEVLAAERVKVKAFVSSLFQRYYPRGVDPRAHPHPMENLKDVLSLYNLTEDDTPTLDALDETYGKLYTECIQSFAASERIGLLADIEVDRMIRKILDRLKEGRELLGHLYANAKCSTAAGLSGSYEPDSHSMWRFTSRENPDEDFTSYQKLVIYLINRAHARGYSRYRESMMLPIRTPDGIATGAWKTAMSITDYVWSITAEKLTNNAMWYHFTKDKNCVKYAIDYLNTSKDPEIPWLRPDRHIFCFSQGMYLAKEERFIPYTDFAKVFPCGPPVACNYFDVPFDFHLIEACDDYMQIPTPAFDQILNSQNVSVTMKRWVYALFIGRMLYNVGEMDDYQIHPFVKGLANTGKSKMLDVIRSIYNYNDVGILPNNIEVVFGLAPIANKFIAIADDIRTNIKLDQSDFQNMASGNAMSLPVKHKDPCKMDHWTCDVVWAGNEVMNFHDNAGSVSRRLAILLFALTVQQVDMTLGSRLQAELPYLIIKGNWAYRNILRRYGTKKGVWEIIPREFKEQRAELAASANALANLLASDLIVYGKDKYMPLVALRDMLSEHAKKINFALPAWKQDYYMGPFNLHGLTVTTSHKEWPRNQVLQKDKDGKPIGTKKKLHTTFVVGCEARTFCDDDAAAQDVPPPQQKT